MNSSSKNILLKTFLAVILIIGFYAMAIGISVLFLYIPYAQIVYGHTLSKGSIFIAICAFVIIWSIIPRPDRFKPPGPKIMPAEQPELFNLINEVAEFTGQKPPSEVYIINDINAYVMERGGIMGIGSKRVMGIGLPLLQIMSVSQLKAVIAHEFGHYCGGDTKLGPWIYKTRVAIGRTLDGLSSQGSIIQIPFVLYAKMYLRITFAISRAQEFQADLIAAKAVSPGVMIEGLKVVHRTAPAYEYYWRNEVAAVLDSGFIPPITAGFSHFIEAPEISNLISMQMDEEMKNRKADVYDTHPSLKDRISALENLPDNGFRPDNTPSIKLMNNLPAIEKKILEIMGGEKAVNSLKRVEWSDVGPNVYLPYWRNNVKENFSFLRNITFDSLPCLSKEPQKLIDILDKTPKKIPDKQEAIRFISEIIGSSVAVTLFKNKFTMIVLPGQPVLLKADEITIAPFTLMHDLSSGKLNEDTWKDLCEKLNLCGVELGTAININ